MQKNPLILKAAFEIIRRFQKPHYSSNQNKNLVKTKNKHFKKLRFKRDII